MAIKSNMMKLLIASCILAVILLVGNERGEEKLYIPTEQDSLSYLANNADLIAIVEIYTGEDLFDKKLTIPNSVGARLEEVIFNKKSEADVSKDFKIKNAPHILHEGLLSVHMTINNGRSLAFLNFKESGLFYPTTSFGVIPIYGNKVSPIWTQSSNAKERAVTVENVINEIKSLNLKSI